MCKYDVLIKEDFFLISTSVLQEQTTAAKMLFVTIPKVPTSVGVNLDVLEMDGLAEVNARIALIFFDEQRDRN